MAIEGIKAPPADSKKLVEAKKSEEKTQEVDAQKQETNRLESELAARPSIATA